jgi:4,5-dihydroxyphthalate decarboxylase
MRRRLTLACWDYDRTAALADGRVTPQGIDLQYLSLPVEETFFRMVRHLEFDVAEMSLSTYVLTLERGRPFVAIPVFPSRAFRHNGVYVHSDAGIDEPKDLVGRTVGLPEYQVTACVWIRGILEDLYGLRADSVRYRTGGLRRPGRPEKLGVAPPGVDLRPVDRGDALETMLADGRIDALYTPRTPEPYRRRDPGVRRLWDPVRPEEERYFRRTGIFPIMHTVVVRTEIYEADRWLVRSLFDAFAEAKAIAEGRLAETVASPSLLPWSYDDAAQTVELMGPDFWSYGLAQNADVLDTFLRYSHSQGLASRRFEPAELFAKETLEAFAI